MEWFYLFCFVGCPLTFVYFLMKSVYQTIQQARENEGKPAAKFEITGAMILAGFSLFLTILSTYIVFTS